MEKIGYVYIMSNKHRTTIYIGSTCNLYNRLIQHKERVVKGFTNKYNCHDLLYFEEYRTIQEAYMRERQLKNWRREWKMNLIKTVNPDLNDLSHYFLS